MPPDFTSTGPVPTPPLNTQQGIVFIISGSVIGSSIVLLLFVGFVLLVVCIRRHRKNLTLNSYEVHEISNSVGASLCSELANIVFR